MAFDERLAVRINEENPNHHLWNNNGTWYIHYTFCPTDWTAERVRKSLQTHDLSEARTKRDLIFQNLDCEHLAA
jgi:hypothetical protein